MLQSSSFILFLFGLPLVPSTSFSEIKLFLLKNSDLHLKVVRRPGGKMSPLQL